jgi:tetratricopeptide (TPR) repeat protein
MKARHWPSIASVLVGLLCIPLQQTCADTASELEDAAARIQYAFYTQDVRALQEGLALIAQMDAAALPPGMKDYYGAYGHWKLAQLFAESATGSAGRAAADCERQAKAARTLDVRMAEAYAIEAVCPSLGSSLLSSGCSDRPLRTAGELDPRNPRVQLIELLCHRKDSKDPAAFTKQIGELVDAFERAPPSRPGKPDWGLAEALLLQGESYLQRGDPRAARDAIERALVIAPDYRKAQELLLAAAARPN